ncbi:proline/betaine transporter [Caedimonas varicaedens]|uniref:Proline/betaine transporter n=1 Tax=Caedimonas varicaedens TaxID=1629334 RepID=A0A0K8MCP9_9PROT|nr:proline/betaine transporter [Caedimonas varicaedens]
MLKCLSKIPNHYLVLGGNFLAFFDLYLYIHLAVIINQHFLPHHSFFMTESFSLLNIYLLAPVVSLLFGFWGDNKGRKKVVVYCSLIMAVATFLILILPSYESIGVFAGYFFVCLRLLQGIALAGEPAAVALYMIESVPIKQSPFYLSLVCAMESLGGIFALGLGSITLYYDLPWRIPFVGAFIFVIFSLFLRQHLEETPEYRQANTTERIAKGYETKKLSEIYHLLPLKKRNLICSALVNFSYPMAFVTSYLYLGRYLTESYGFQTTTLLLHNLGVAACETVLRILMGYLTSRSSIMPGKLLAGRLCVAMAAACTMPYVLNTYHSAGLVFLFQVIFVSCMSTDLVIGSILKTFPVVGRFSLAAFGFLMNRIVAFFLMTVVFHVMTTTYGFLGNAVMLLLGCGLVCLGLYFYVPYEKKEEYLTDAILNKYSIVSNKYEGR